MDKFKSNPFYYKVFGEYALFTDPVTKGGGERFTYSVPTYEAIRGVTEAIYWKPTIKIVIDEIKVMNPILTETKAILPNVKKGKVNTSERSYNTYLKDVEYLVKYHFEWNENREDLKNDRNEKKHEQIILRSLDKGGRHDVFLGTRECVAYIERLRKDEYDKAKSYYDNQIINMGVMFKNFIYPHRIDDDSYSNLESVFTHVILKNGKIDFNEELETFSNALRSYKVKDDSKIKSVDQELEEMEKGI